MLIETWVEERNGKDAAQGRRHRRDGFQRRLGLCIYSRRNADGSLGDYRAFVFSALASVGWSKFHLRRQRVGFPSDVSGASSMDAT